MANVGETVRLSGWVQAVRDLGSMTFIDLRDRYGITQLVFSMESDAGLCEQARRLGREFVINIEGAVRERSAKNPNRPTGDVEVVATAFRLLNASKVPPFTIDDESDGGDELRMKYRYLDLRRSPVQRNIIFRSQLALEVRKHLSGQHFVEVETPFLIKSTPEGARDFVVPSRMNPGQFYALPQSPQTFKQILMVAGLDRYFQIVKCFRDEDLRADRQPEFTQIDCEMAFVTRADILHTFEGLTKHLFHATIGVELPDFPLMSYDDAIRQYGSDKPDLRFGMAFRELTGLAKGRGFVVFDTAEIVVGITATGQAGYTRKQLDELTEWVKRPQIGAKGLVYVRYNPDGTLKSSVDKFFSEADLRQWAEAMGAQPGDLMLVLAGETEKTRKQLGDLRLEMGRQLGLMTPGVFKPLWVVDFPLLEWDDETQRFYAMHHPFTSPKPDDIARMASDDRQVLKDLRADAYDLVINGVEIGGGSIRIHNRELQEKNFRLLGFTQQEAERQFGFLLGAFEYGAPPHGGIAFGFDRLCAVMNGQNSIRDFIAFPKNNTGRDMMIDAPSEIAQEQLQELSLALSLKKQP
jgi:aspartyl-tRNA synthetase